MAMSLDDALRAHRAATKRAIQQRQAELRRFAADAEGVGRRVYERGIQTGERVLARTPAEVRALGFAALQGRLPQAVGEMAGRKVAQHVRPAPVRSAPSAPAPKPGAPRPAKAKSSSAPMEHVRAGVSGFVDEGTFGLADHVLAASNAVGEAFRDGTMAELVEDYDASMALKRNADAYDAEHYGAARSAGRVAGVAGTIAVMGAPGAARALIMAAPRMRGAEQAARLGLRYGPDPRGLTRMSLYGGAAAGVGDQVVTDALTGEEGSLLENAAAAAGGAAGGVVTRFTGPSVGGAVGGATTSALNDLANYRPISLDDALEASRLSAVLGKFGGTAGTRWVENLSSRGKGEAGELLTDIKAAVRGDRIIGRQAWTPVTVGGRRRFTRVDTVTERGGQRHFNEAKMGPNARLSDQQVAALNQHGDRYIVDHWRFADVGKATGAAASPIGAHLAAEDDPYRPW